MKSTLIVLSILTALFWSCKEDKSKEAKRIDFRAKLEASNKLFNRALQNKNLDSIIDFYGNTFTFMPEYKTAIFRKDKLNVFYKDWLDLTDIINYKKDIYEVKVIDGRVLEIGTYEMDFRHESDSLREYNGKYMILWQDDEKGRLKIISEIFGSDIFINPESVPYSNVTVRDDTNKKPNGIGEKLKKEILKVNQAVIKAVEDGDGNTRTNGFTSDGIYMPHFGKMLVGIDSIRPYMLRTYQPEASLYVVHNYYDILDFGTYVLVNAHFKGGWGNSINGGTFEGNMSNLRKRTEDGQLLMYRQLANNDR